MKSERTIYEVHNLYELFMNCKIILHSFVKDFYNRTVDKENYNC